MRAVVLDGFGGLEVLKVREVERPRPAEGQVLVRVVATSVNRPDLVQREGKYPAPPGDSEILGLEVAGTVAEIGPGVAGWSLGDQVLSLVGGGGYAEFAVAHADHLMRIPGAMSFEEAACVCESYITAYLNLFLIGGLVDGDAVLVHGGGGGVATAAVQICKALLPRARIITTAHPTKADRVRALGVDRIIDYTTTPEFSQVVKEFTGKKGVDVILDHVGAKYLQENMSSLAYGGRLVVIGVVGGIRAELNLALMMVKRQQITGSVLRSRPVKDKAAIVAEFTRAVLPRFADRTIVPIVENVFPIDRVVDAHRLMEEDRHFGKIVLRVA
jgi:putative PIG3 family NAD(P)H quinone oxidoreductase